VGASFTFLSSPYSCCKPRIHMLASAPTKKTTAVSDEFAAEIFSAGWRSVATGGIPMQRMRFPLLGCVLFCLVIGSGNVWAQGTAQISGSAHDQTGAVLPGVEIQVTQTDTGIMREALTNETGLYVLPNLPIGPYRLEASLPGVCTYTPTRNVLSVKRRASNKPFLG